MTMRGIAWLLVLVTASSLAAPASAPMMIGENIYRHGVLSTGEPLRGERAAASGVQGAAAACANCHRRSGLGEVEGVTLIPPITAKYLYSAGNRSAYTDATLARAIREGVGSDGRVLHYLMPHFRIGDSDAASLIAYLKQLSSRPSPGVGDATLQFATIVTPDADPLRRRAMLDVLEHFFGKDNVFSAGQGPAPQLSHRFNPLPHRWQLHVWELSGAPDSWKAQLDERLRREPVFAVISGIGGRSWEPVHRFCEESGVPCLFPNVDLPVVEEQDFYDIYWCKGVLLEAELIAARLQSSADASGGTPAEGRRVVQVYRRGYTGQGAALQLRGDLSTRAAEVTDRVLDPGTDPTQVREAFSDSRPGDEWVLWLRPEDIGSLPPQPPAGAVVFVSGIMGGLERTPLTPAWRGVARMTYLLDLPDRRRLSMEYPLSWMRLKQIPVVDERTQTDTYLACVVVAETVGMMGEDLVRDHLVEMLEMHLGRRLVDGHYPRLGLADGQRFASKGGFLVRFPDAQGPR